MKGQISTETNSIWRRSMLSIQMLQTSQRCQILLEIMHCVYLSRPQVSLLSQHPLLLLFLLENIRAVSVGTLGKAKGISHYTLCFSSHKDFQEHKNVHVNSVNSKCCWQLSSKCHSEVSDPLKPHRLYPVSLLCP